MSFKMPTGKKLDSMLDKLSAKDIKEIRAQFELDVQKKSKILDERNMKMSEEKPITEKPITKSFLEQKIHEKAVEHWKDDVRRAFSSFRNPLFDKLIIAGDLRKKLDTGDHATLQSELSGDYSYTEQEAFLRCICSNYDETKERTIKEYEQRNTDMILNSLSSLGDYLNDNRRY